MLIDMLFASLSTMFTLDTLQRDAYKMSFVTQYYFIYKCGSIDQRFQVNKIKIRMLKVYKINILTIITVRKHYDIFDSGSL